MARHVLMWILTGAVMGGCQTAPVVPHASLGSELKRQDDQLVGQRFRTLLDFESDSDSVFARADAAGHRETGAAHTGNGFFEADGGAAFKINPLLYGAALPGEWTLLGAYVRPESAGPVVAELLIDGKAVASYSREVPAATWAFVGIDLADEQTRSALADRSAKQIALHLSSARAAYDDVLLVNNTRTLVSYTGPADWQIEQKGAALRTTCKALSVTIPLAGAAENGWSIDEISARRLCMHRGDTYQTLLPDGRSIVGGISEPKPEVAKLDIPEECGRLDRDTPGDANNDGYNERTGSFELKANGPRLTFKLTPGAAPMQSPLIDIAGIPPGKLTVMAEGKLIDTVTRLPDGRVLLLLPINLDQPIEIVIRTSDNVR